MPLPDLADPPNRADRISGLARALPTSAALFSTLLLFNAAQTASLAVRPFSPKMFRTFNRWAANTWWGWCVTGAEWLNDVRVEVTGDEVPLRENALVLANHQQMPDITFLMVYARSKDRLGDLKWFAKRAIKYVPGVGWGMWFLDCPFVDRDWSRDRVSIERTFAQLRDHRVPLWLITFPEGTRLTPEKAEASRLHALARGLPATTHVLLPRSKGFVASVQGLRDHLDAVYDITIGYEQGVPTLWQYVKGWAKRAHLHVRRTPIAAMPSDDEELARWLRQRFVEKDRLLDEFYRTGRLG
jgi:1-acyl-sn-glycerol-3-phosphate acyltransferase